MTETSISKNTFNPDDMKFLERENFEGFIKIVETVGLPIYLDEVYASDFSRIYAMLEAIRKLGKAAAGRFEIIIRGNPYLIRKGRVPHMINYNIHCYTGDKAMRAYMTQIVAAFPEISYYLTNRSQQILPAFFVKVRRHGGEYWPKDPFDEEYRRTEKMLDDAAIQYHDSLES